MKKIFASVRNNSFTWLSCLLVLGIALSRSISLPEPDTLWQTRFGLDAIASGHIHYSDTYSWTMGGTPYISNSWLWNVALGFLYSIGGISTIVGITFVLILVIMSLLTFLFRVNNISWPMSFIGIAAFGLFSNLWLSARPQLIDYASILCILLIAKFLDFTSRKGIIRGAILLFAVIVIWQNFHLSAPLGVVVIFFVVLDNMLENAGIGQRVSKDILIPVMKAGSIAAFTAVGCFLTPFGINGVSKGLDTSGASVGIISEWKSPISEFTDIGWFSVVSIILGILALIHTWKTRRLSYSVLVLLLVVLTCQQNRWSPFLAIISLVPFLQFLTVFSYHRPISKLRPYFYAASAAVTIIFLGIGSLALTPHDVLANSKSGYTTASHLPAGCKLFNDIVTGGATILFRPDIKVATDGRNDLYGRERYIHYATLGANDSTAALTWLDEQQVTCVVTSPYRNLGKVLESSDKWRVSYVDNDGFKVFLKEKS